LLKSRGIVILFLCATALIAGCGGGASPTVAPTPESGSNSTTFAAQSAAQTIALPSTGGITGTLAVPGVTVTSGSLPTLTATIVTGSDATLTKRRDGLLPGGPYLAEIQITAPVTFTLTEMPGFSIYVTQWKQIVPNGAYGVVVFDSSQAEGTVALVTAQNDVLQFAGSSTPLTINKGDALIMGILNLNSAAAPPAGWPTFNPGGGGGGGGCTNANCGAPSSSPSPTASPATSPSASPTSAASATECVTGATWSYTSTGTDNSNIFTSTGVSSCGLDPSGPNLAELGANSAATTVTYNVWNGAPHGIVLASSAVTNPQVTFALELTGDGTTTFTESVTSGGFFLALEYLATASEITGTGTYYWGYCKENSATSPTGCASGTTTADQSVSVTASAGSDTSVDTSNITTGSFVFGSAPYLIEIYTGTSSAAIRKR
jgi:hypothetical protein